jgi:hypothetical protein
VSPIDTGRRAVKLSSAYAAFLNEQPPSSDFDSEDTRKCVEHNRLRLSRCNFRIAVGLSRASIKKQKGPDAGRGLSWSRLAHAGACWTPGGKCVSKSARE